jgi:oligopeptide/dipeptide ABC transporter ATP-binding protein
MEALVNVINLKKYFPLKSGLLGRVYGYVRAVDDVTLSIGRGEVLGLVGESGSGKTTVGRCILRLIEPTAGDIYFEGTNITKLKGKALKPFRKHMQAVFQNPFQSLNPRMSVTDIISEPLKTHTKMVEEEIVGRAIELLKLVGLSEEQLYKYPHELSGGQAQRVAIARAIALNPKFIILDEPTSALDVSVQAQILNILADLKKQFNLTYMFISHDLSVAQYVSDRVAVAYLGRIVELGNSTDLFANPLHPYSQALLSQVPIPNPKIARGKKKILIKGEIQSSIAPPPGCKFHPRCIYVKEKCMHEEPPLVEVENRLVRCWLYT